MAYNLNVKSDKPKIISFLPTKQYGKDGDIVISKLKNKGVFFCIRVHGIWYAQTTMRPLNRINDIFLKKLKSENLTLTRISNSNIDTDKFAVLDDGTIKYRTGDQILEDIGAPAIEYKTAYCSLAQYSNKETCESNGGTWYYSENDSHDSISSTAENQLLTVSQSIGKLDAESKLTYDGSTLDIRYNSDYDDNWQTSAQEDLLKLSRDDTV